MKKIIKFIGLLSLIGFSFFYTDKVMNILLEKDPIMIEINNHKDEYEVLATNATIESDTIIPGIVGKTVLEKESYNNMKNIGTYLENYLVFENVKPEISVENNYDKYIISGNKNNKSISIIFIISNKKQLDIIENKLKGKTISINYFITEDFLAKYSNAIKDLKNREIYNYGNNGEYTEEKLLYNNNLITRITNNNSKYCLAKEKNDKILKLCSKNKLYTILPNIIIKNNMYSEIKDKIENGSIILVDSNNININNLNNTINYIKLKGLNIVYLKTLLSENLE